MKAFHCQFLVNSGKTIGNLVHGEARSSLIILSLVLLAFQFSTPLSLGQATTSTIEGTVRDANGALVAGAQVKVSSGTLATERTVVTDSDGFYRIVSLPAGTYTLTVNQPGFAV